MKAVRCLFIFFIFTSFHSFAQTDLSKLHPQPRQAYQRFLSAVFDPHPGHVIFVLPGETPRTAAAELNAFFREKGKDTLEVRAFAPTDTQESGIFLGVRAAEINAMIAALGDQPAEVTGSWPGAEGYVMDALPSRVLVNGSDEQGLLYGTRTLMQLLFSSAQWWGLEACRIIDAPEFPVRWFYNSTNVLVGDNVTAAKTLWDEAITHRLNGVHLVDSKFTRPTTLPQRYLDSLASLRDYASARHLEIIPGVMPIGYSNSLLFHNPNLASGLPVRHQRFVIDNGEARLVPRTDVALPNGGFEQHNGDSFPGFTFIDQPGSISFADTQVKHSGAVSVRMENFAQHSPEHGHGRVSYWTPVTPFTQYHVSAWVKTENLQPASSINLTVLSNAGYPLAYNDYAIPATTDWMRLDFTINTLEADTVGLYFGTWGAKSGRMWWDDLAFEETAFINLIRRNGAPLVATHPVLTVVYAEGVDYDTLRDARMGNNMYPGNYDKYHEPPVLRSTTSGALQEGDTMLVSWDHAVVIHDDQVMTTMSDPEVYDILDREFRVLDSVLLADRYFMQHDEIRTMNWDTGDQLRALEPAAILADNVRRCEAIIQKHHPGADVWVWSDMFDEFHNAVQGPYYLVRGDLRGSADDIPSSVGMVNWNGREGIAQNSLGFFADRGFRQISAPYYDRDEQQIRRWKEWTHDVPDFEGMMYTTWQKKYDHLEAFGDYAWNHAPYVYHTPLWGITPGQKALTWTKVIGDRWDPDWELTDCRMHLRHHPGDPFTEVVIPSVPGELTEHWIDIPATATWMQWYVTATDNRGWTTRIPFVDTLYYEVGDITTALSPLAASPALHCAAYPQPAYVGAELMLEWYVPGNAATEFTVHDMLGRRVYEQNLGASDARMRTTRLQLPQLPRGVYIGMLRSAQGSRSMRIAVQ